MVSTKIMGRHMRNIEESLWQAMNKQKKEKAAKADAATKRGGEGCESGIGKLWSQLKPTKKTAVAEADDGGEGEGASAEMEGEEIDDSIASIRLQAIQVEHTSSRELDVVPISESVGLRCFQWLRLMTMYFEAMDQLLSSGLTSPRLPKNTTVQFVAVKHQGEKRMNWERCLTTRRLIPGSNPMVHSLKTTSGEHFIVKLSLPSSCTFNANAQRSCFRYVSCLIPSLQ
jgi:hypothetical protein